MSDKKSMGLMLDDDDRKIIEIIMNIHTFGNSEKLELKNEIFAALNYQSLIKRHAKVWTVKRMKKRLKKYVAAGFFKKYVRTKEINGNMAHKIFIYPGANLPENFIPEKLPEPKTVPEPKKDTGEKTELEQESIPDPDLNPDDKKIQLRRDYISLQIQKMQKKGVKDSTMVTNLNQDNIISLNGEKWSISTLRAFIRDMQE